MRQTMQIRARAKINWSLDVVGVRADGYHLLDGIMQPIALSDTLTIAPADDLTLSIAGAPDLSPGEDNLVLKAARALIGESGISAGARITLQKRIPRGAGLGGGSADCAAALKGLSEFWGLALPPDALLRLGEALGADVPFCLADRPCRVRGIGESLTPLPCGRTFPLVLIQPCEALSTREVFAAWRQNGIPSPDTDGAAAALARGDLSALNQCAGNVLEAASIPLRPGIRSAKEDLIALGAGMARMTGSGSAVFGAFEEDAAARSACAALQKKYAVCILTQTAV